MDRLRTTCILGCIAACTCESPCSMHARQEFTIFTILDDPVLRLIDGLPFIKINNIRYMAACMRELQFGTKDEHGTAQGTIKYQDSLYTLKQMIDIENSLSRPFPSDYTKTFDTTIDYCISLSAPYEEESLPIKSYVLKLIDRWCKKCNRPHSLLLEWGKIEKLDVKEFKKVISTFQELDNLITDLTIFLADFMISCPKTFVASFKNPEEGKALLRKIYDQIEESQKNSQGTD